MRNREIDRLKFFAALFIVYIHICLPGIAGEAVSAAARFGVPVFFISSGYFSYTAINNQDFSKLKKRILSLVKLFAVSFLLYILGYIVLNQRSCIDNMINDLKDPVTYVKMFVFNLPVNTSFGHLWFILALIYVYLATAAIMKFKVVRIFKYIPLLLIFTLFFFNIIMGKMEMEISPLLGRNFLMTGLPFFSVGYCLRSSDICHIHNIKRYIYVGLLSGIVILVLEFCFLNRKSELYFGSVLIAVSLFVLALCRNEKCKSNSAGFELPLSDLSLYVYIGHILACNVITEISGLTGFADVSVFVWVKPVISTLVVILIYFVIYSIKKLFKKKHKALSKG